VVEPAPAPRPLFGVPTADRGVLCHGCTTAGRCRFGLERIELDDDGVLRASATCTDEFQGGPGMAHGGWISAVLADVTGFVIILRAGFAVTAGLRVDFRRPVPLHQPLTLNAHGVASDDGRWHVVGELRDAESDVLLAGAEAVFIEQDESYFDRLGGGSDTPTR